MNGTGSFVSEMADLLLNGLTNGRHGRLVAQQQRRGEEAVKNDKEKKSPCEGGLEGDRHERSVPQEGEDSTKDKDAGKELVTSVVETEGWTGGPPEADGLSSKGGTVEGPGVPVRAKVSQKYVGLTSYHNYIFWPPVIANLICVSAIIACGYSWLQRAHVRTHTHTHTHTRTACHWQWWEVRVHGRLHVCGC